MYKKIFILSLTYLIIPQKSFAENCPAFQIEKNFSEGKIQISQDYTEKDLEASQKTENKHLFGLTKDILFLNAIPYIENNNNKICLKYLKIFYGTEQTTVFIASEFKNENYQKILNHEKKHIFLHYETHQNIENFFNVFDNLHESFTNKNDLTNTLEEDLKNLKNQIEENNKEKDYILDTTETNYPNTQE